MELTTLLHSTLPVLVSAECLLAPSSMFPRSHDTDNLKSEAQEREKMRLPWQHVHRFSTDYETYKRLEGPVISQASGHKGKVISSTERFIGSNLEV